MMNRSQIFYAARPDSFADSLFSNVGNKNHNKNKRNDSSIGRSDIPDSFELSIVSRGRNQLCQMRNKTTIFEKPMNKPIKRVYKRSPLGSSATQIPKALQDGSVS